MTDSHSGVRNVQRAFWLAVSLLIAIGMALSADELRGVIDWLAGGWFGNAQ